MLRISAEHSAPYSVEKCHQAIALAMYYQLESLMLDGRAVITPAWVGKRKSGRSHLEIVSQPGDGQCCVDLLAAV